MKAAGSMDWRAWCVFAALGIIWGLPYFFIKLAVREFPPFFVAWSRILLAALILLPLAWQRGALRPVWNHKAAILAFALAEFAIPFAAISFAERSIDSSATGIVIASVPFTIILIARFFGVREPFEPGRLLGLALGLCGVIILLGFGTVAEAHDWTGVLCLACATLGYASGALIIQRHLSELDAIGPLAASLALAAVLLLPPALLTAPPRIAWDLASFAIIVLGVLCTAVAMLLMFYLIRRAGASRASVITYINPAVATLLGVLLLHERLGANGLLAFALILSGSWLATRRRAAPRGSMLRPA
ncbi:MAG TPA: DMT family transporter [Steroidobacteraceae bacterium]